MTYLLHPIINKQTSLFLRHTSRSKGVVDGMVLLKFLFPHFPQVQQALRSHSIRAPFLVPWDQNNSNDPIDLHSTALKELQVLTPFLSG